ncbi:MULTISPECIES: transposase [unclassified Synechococcus]|uniref:transposase n=1 Tax=unclassified Synechococcus TaxID=2626047 RepID=UPI0020CF3ABD|nr:MULTISPECIES: transposase [unclassified Synechococcus]
MPSGAVAGRREVRAAGPDPQRRRAAMEAARQRYGGLSAAGKRRLLDELEAITGYHRKSLLRLLNRQAVAPAESEGPLDQAALKPHPRRRYGPEATAALVPLWEASDRLCGKRLVALLPLLVESLEQHGHLSLEPAVREQVLVMSSATIDRLLGPIRKASAANNWRRPPRAYSSVRRRVPVRTFKGWSNHREPGWLEIDLVAHCGGRMQGPFLWTLMATDIATGWSESLPILVRDGAVVLTALQLIRRQLPFPLRGIDADNDPVFMNSLMEAWCDRPGHQIVLTRSRAYQSNDQAWVEQKNGMLVRRVVGYQRLEGLEAAQVLGELYGALRLFTNLFQPSFKLKSSERDGGRIKRQHHPPRTPLQRLLASGVLSEETAEPWRELRRRSDPVALLATIRRCQGQLAVLASAEEGSALQASRTERDLAAENRSLEVFLGGLQDLWQNNQPRRRKPKPRIGKRSRPDPFEPDVERIEQWLQAEPQLRAKTLLERLIDHNPERYSPRHLRTLQRRLRGYRLQWIENEMAALAVAGPPSLQEGESVQKPVLPGVN